MCISFVRGCGMMRLPSFSRLTSEVMKSTRAHFHSLRMLADARNSDIPCPGHDAPMASSSCGVHMHVRGLTASNVGCKTSNEGPGGIDADYSSRMSECTSMLHICVASINFTQLRQSVSIIKEVDSRSFVFKIQLVFRIRRERTKPKSVKVTCLVPHVLDIEVKCPYADIRILALLVTMETHKTVQVSKSLTFAAQHMFDANVCGATACPASR